MPDIRIRQAKSSDVVRIYKLLKESGEWPGMRLGEISEPRAYQLILTLIQGSYVVVADLSGNLVGTTGLAVIQPPWSDGMILHSTWHVVQRAHQQGGVAQALFRSALKYAGKHRLGLHLQLSTHDMQTLGQEDLVALGLKAAGQVFTFDGIADEHAVPEENNNEEEGGPRTGI